MKKNVTKWFWMICIAAMALSMTSSTAFTEGTGDSTKEGIKVHGHWKIVVMNPDGTVDSITEFDNALIIAADSGGELIVNLMANQSVHGAWWIRFYGTSGAGPCDTGGNPAACVIAESGVSNGTITHSTDLSVSDNGTTLTLFGSVVAAYADSILSVSTYSGACVSTTTTIDSCRTTGPTFNGFTSTTLGTNPAVVPSQVIQVTVDISFS